MNSKDETDDACDKEIQAGLKLYREGRVKALPLEEVKSDIAARLSECRRRTGSNECLNPTSE